MYHVYILYSPSHDKYYVGQTQDLEQRLLEHNELSTKSYTSKYRPWELKLALPVESRSQAMLIEKYIKKQRSKRYIKELIEMEERRQSLLLRFRE